MSTETTVKTIAMPPPAVSSLVPRTVALNHHSAMTPTPVRFTEDPDDTSTSIRMMSNDSFARIAILLLIRSDADASQTHEPCRSLTLDTAR